MPRLLCLSLILCASVAFAGENETLDALEQRYEEYQARQRELGELALSLRAAQRRFMRARADLERFRKGKSPEELSAARVQVDALEGELVAARGAYEKRLRGEEGSRYRQLKALVEESLRSLAAGVGNHLRENETPRARRLRAALFVDKGHFSLAERDLERVLAKHADDAIALTLRGRCLEARGATEAAYKDYERALLIAPSDERRLRAAVAAYWLNDFKGAIALRDGVKDLSKVPAQLKLDHGWYLKAPGLERAAERWERELTLRAADAKKGDLPRVELTTSRGKIVIELFEDQAPNTVANFVELVEKGFYAGLPWHRVQPLRLAATGQPKEPGQDPGGPGYAIEGEARAEQARHHFRGSVGLLIRGPNRRGGSQFYLSIRPDPDLDGECTVFGRVVEGMDAVVRLEKDDLLSSARVLRKREHPYVSKKIPLGKPGR